MNRLLVMALSCLLGLIIIVAQAARKRPAALFDSLGVSSAIYALLFAVIPIWLNSVDLSEFGETGWRWILSRPFDDHSVVQASVIALVGYLIILCGKQLGDATIRTIAQMRTLPSGILNERTSARQIVMTGAILLCLGGSALVVYTFSIGGVRSLLLDALLFRGETPPVVTRWAFLKNVGFSLLGASYCFFAARREVSSKWERFSVGVLFWIAFGLSLAQLFHAAGRLPLVAYVATFPLAAMMRDGRWRWRTMTVLTVVMLIVLVFGKQLFFPRTASEELASRWETLGRDLDRASKDVMIEFAFPYLTLANATMDVPERSPYRMFQDLPLAVLYLVPQRVFGLSHPPMVSAVNTNLLTDGQSGTIPVDLLSFGFFSAGVVGVVLVALIFGLALSFNELLFPGRRGTVFRVALTVFLAFRVMYGDPSLIMQTGFYLVITIALLLITGLLREVSVGAATVGRGTV